MKRPLGGHDPVTPADRPTTEYPPTAEHRPTPVPAAHPTPGAQPAPRAHPTPGAQPAPRAHPTPGAQPAPPRRAASGTWVAVTFWILTRCVMFVLARGPDAGVDWDVSYYFENIHKLAGDSPYLDVLPEYPLPTVGLLALPYLLGGGHEQLYWYGFVAMMAALDAVFCVALFRLRHRFSAAPFWVWMAIAPLLGILTYTRYDLVPGVLAAFALLGLTQAPTRSGQLLAIGTAVKLWPAALLPSLLARRRNIPRVLTSFAVTGGILVAGSLAVAGWDRLLSPLAHQGARGLQIESVWATPLMVGRISAPESYPVELVSWSLEVTGPGEDLMLMLASAATATGLVIIGVLAFRMLRAPAARNLAPPAMMAATVALLLASNKVLSPQYVLWLAPIIAVLLGVERQERTAGRWAGPTGGGARTLAALILGITLLTHVVYPYSYLAITAPTGSAAATLGLITLALRNALVVITAALAVRYAWATTAEHPTIRDRA